MTPIDREPKPGTVRVALRGIEKSFPGVQALRGVDFDAKAGEIHALCGENGAGKSTLIGVLSGRLRLDAGSIELDGQSVRFRGPAGALAEGVATIHQEFSLVGSLTVAENLALGSEPRIGPWLDRRAIRRGAAEHLRSLGFPLDPNVRADSLTTGQRQLLEIARALGHHQARVLVLDEPTAALTRAEAERLFEVLGGLKSSGLAIVYISHHLDEVLRIADRVTVLRDGSRVGTWPVGELTPEKLMSAMVGEVVERRHMSRQHLDSPPILRLEQAAGRGFFDVNLEIRPGEIVGLTGLAGAGHEEVARVLFGASRLRSGRLTWHGRPFRPRHPAVAKRRGIASVPGDRRGEGLIPSWDIERNATLAILPRLARLGWLDTKGRRRAAEHLCRQYEVASAGLQQRAATLSGGNQQKVLLARWTATGPSLLILNDPTRGIDVRTREAIHRRVEDLAREGLAVLLVTSDTHELLRLADRLVVFRSGRIVRDLAADQADEHTVLAAMVEDATSRPEAS